MAGPETVLETDTHNGEPGHADKHNDANAQINYLTEQVAGRLAEDELLATFQRKSPAAVLANLPEHWIMAHRANGGSEGPEATVTGGKIAIAGGAHAIEFDPRRLADRVTWVVCHDDNTLRTTGVDAAVESLTAAAIAQLNAAAGFPWWGRHEPMPYFTDFVREFGGKVLLVPTPKEGVDSTECFDLVKSWGLQESFLFVSRSLDVLDYIKAEGGLCGYSYNGAPGAGGRPSIATVIGHDADMITIGFAAAGVNDGHVQAVIEACAVAGIQSGVWTMNRRWERDKYRAMGANCTITDQSTYQAHDTALSLTDSWRYKSLGPGLVSSANDPADPVPPARLEFRGDGALITRSTTPSVSYLFGEVSPLADWDEDDWSYDFWVGFESVPASPSAGSVGMLFGAPDDRGHTFNSGSHRLSAYPRIRGDGLVQLWRYTDASTNVQLGADLVTPALTAGGLAHLRFSGSRTELRLTRIDGGPYAPIVVSDSIRLGGYVHLTRQGTTTPAMWKGFGPTA